MVGLAPQICCIAGYETKWRGKSPPNMDVNSDLSMMEFVLGLCAGVYGNLIFLYTGTGTGI